MIDLSDFKLHEVISSNGIDMIVDRILCLFKMDKGIVGLCQAYNLTDEYYDNIRVAFLNISSEEFDKELNNESPMIRTCDDVYDGIVHDNGIRLSPYLNYSNRDDYWNHWENTYITIKNHSGKDVADRILAKEESRWGDFLWLGRHLYLVDTGYFDNVSDEPQIIDTETGERLNFDKMALQEGEAMIKKYEDLVDYDFLMCMKYPSSKNGDEEWEHICNNVGTLRQFLWGEWDLSS